MKDLYAVLMNIALVIAIPLAIIYAVTRTWERRP